MDSFLWTPSELWHHGAAFQIWLWVKSTHMNCYCSWITSDIMRPSHEEKRMLYSKFDNTTAFAFQILDSFRTVHCQGWLRFSGVFVKSEKMISVTERHHSYPGFQSVSIGTFRRNISYYKMKILIYDKYANLMYAWRREKIRQFLDHQAFTTLYHLRSHEKKLRLPFSYSLLHTYLYKGHVTI